MTAGPTNASSGSSPASTARSRSSHADLTARSLQSRRIHAKSFSAACFVESAKAALLRSDAARNTARARASREAPRRFHDIAWEQNANPVARREGECVESQPNSRSAVGVGDGAARILEGLFEALVGFLPDSAQSGDVLFGARVLSADQQADGQPPAPADGG